MIICFILITKHFISCAKCKENLHTDRLAGVETRLMCARTICYQSSFNTQVNIDHNIIIHHYPSLVIIRHIRFTVSRNYAISAVFIRTFICTTWDNEDKTERFIQHHYKALNGLAPDSLSTLLFINLPALCVHQLLITCLQIKNYNLP